MGHRINKFGQHLNTFFFAPFPDNNFRSSEMALLILKFNILLWIFVPSIASREVIIIIIIIIIEVVIAVIIIITLIASREVINTAIFITTTILLTIECY